MRLSELINEHYNDLNDNDLHICQFISTHKKECCSLTIDELASRCNVSRTTILRFAKKLSLKGYSELKVYLRLEVQNQITVKEDVLEMACDSYHKAIDDCKARDYSTICQMLHESRKVYIYGTGHMQRDAAKDMQRKFLSARKSIYQIESETELDILMDMVTPEDLVIFISLSGESRNTVSFARSLKLLKVPTIALTRLKENSLARCTTQNLYAGTLTIPFKICKDYETSMLFNMMTEILLINYMIYVDTIEYNQ